MRHIHIARPHRTTKTKRCAIGNAHRFLFRIKRNDREYGSENFFLRNAHIGLHIIENCRLDIEAARLLHDLLSAQSKARAFLLANRDILQHTFHVFLFDHRTHLC